MTPRPLSGLVFLSGIVAGSIVSFLSIQTLSPSSPVKSVVESDSLHHLTREIDIDLLCNISRKSLLVQRLQRTDSPLLESLKSSDEAKDGHPSESMHLSHDEINKQVVPKEETHFADEHHHKDEVEIARELASKVRVLCWVMTSPENHQTRAIHVQATWGKRCDKLLFVSEQTDKSLPVLKVSVDHGREHLTAKTMAAFDHIFEDHFKEADWFLKADDDTYVVVENLKYFLSTQNSSEPVYFGHHFKTIVKQGYFSGGGGYVLSKEALRRYSKRQKGACRDDLGAEDAEMGKCMEVLGVRTGDSRDKLGRSRFHCFNPETHIHGGYPDWYYSYDKYGAQKGIESISDYAITFHYVSVEQLYNLEFYIYHLRPYGIINGLQNLNYVGTEQVTTLPQSVKPS